MYLGVYRFEGDPASLLAAYERLVSGIPAANLQFHACVQRDGAIEVYDTCPSREIFESFAASAQFRNAVSAAGLPPPRVTTLGEARAIFAQGKRVV